MKHDIVIPHIMTFAVDYEALMLLHFQMSSSYTITYKIKILSCQKGTEVSNMLGQYNFFDYY